MRTHIKANQPWWRINWAEIWEYRDLLILLVKRDLTAIYKQTILGPLWFVIQPLLTTIVFTIIFGNVAKIPTDGVPHFIFYMSGTILWNYFQGVLNHGAGSLVANTGVLSKVYFPRLVIPLSGVFVNTQLWMYATPVVFPASLVQKPILKLILWLNPMTAIVEFNRFAFTGQGTPALGGLGLSWGVTVVVLVSGLFLFN